MRRFSSTLMCLLTEHSWWLVRTAAGNQDSVDTAPSADGGEMRQLTTDPTPDWRSSLVSRRQQVAFWIAYRSGKPRHLGHAEAAGGPARQLTTDPARERTASGLDSRRPSGWILKHDRGDMESTGGLWAVSAEGGEARQLTPTGRGIHPNLLTRMASGLVFVDGGIWRDANVTQVAKPERLTDRGRLVPRDGRRTVDGRSIFGPLRMELRGNVWSLSLQDRTERQLTDSESAENGYLGVCLRG